MSSDQKTVLFFGTFDEAMHPRVSVLAEAVADAGHRVIRCNEPAGVTTEERVNVFRRPWTAPIAAFKFARSWTRLIAKSRRLSVGGHAIDAVVVGYLGVLDVHLARRLFSQPILLDQMAPVGGIARDRGLPLAGVMDRLERWATNAADVVLVDTEEHMPGDDSPASAKSVVVRVGAPGAWFEAGTSGDGTPSDSTASDSTPSDGAAARRGDGDGPLRVCFFGLYTPLQGTTFIGQAIAALAHRDDIRWTLIGDGQDRAEAEATIGSNSSVTWIDWLDRDRLPAVVAAHDVCLGIFGTTPKALRVVPNKVFQGAAVGCAIVTSDTAPQRAALADAGVLVAPGDHAALASAIADLADDRDHLLERRRAARSVADVSFSPNAMARQLDTIIRQAIRKATAGVDDERQTPGHEL